MSVLRPVAREDPVLRKVAAPVRVVDDGVRRLMADLTDTMRSQRAVGLAAPQVGRSARVIVVAPRRSEPVALANPEIVERSGRTVGFEMCVSVPGVIGLVARSRRVRVRGLDQTGTAVEIAARGYRARVFQHEIDHLNGVLFVDRAARWGLVPLRARRLARPIPAQTVVPGGLGS